MMDIMWKILAKLDQDKLPMNRVSMHAINFHMLCFDRKVWRSGKLSVASSIEVSLKMAGGYDKHNFTDIMRDLDKLRFNLPESILIKTKFGDIVKTKHDLIKEPVFSFEYGNQT